MDHAGSVLAQRQIADKSNEIPAFAPLLDSLNLTGTVITADALHTQRFHGTYLRERGAHHLAIVKKNHPALFSRIRALPGREAALDHCDRTRAHHRDEIRRLKTAAFCGTAARDRPRTAEPVRYPRDPTGLASYCSFDQTGVHNFTHMTCS